AGIRRWPARLCPGSRASAQIRRIYFCYRPCLRSEEESKRLPPRLSPRSQRGYANCESRDDLIAANRRAANRPAHSLRYRRGRNESTKAERGCEQAVIPVADRKLTGETKAKLNDERQELKLRPGTGLDLRS